MTSNAKNSNNIDITNLDYKSMRYGYDALINCIILAAIDDLGHDALYDEATLDWLTLTDVSIDALNHAINAMPIKNGKTDARPAMRRIMENLDARENMADVVVQFDQVELDNVTEPTAGELLEIDWDAELENITWEME